VKGQQVEGEKSANVNEIERLIVMLLTLSFWMTDHQQKQSLWIHQQLHCRIKQNKPA